MNPSDSLQLDENLARFLAAFDQGLAGGDGKAPTIELKSPPNKLLAEGSGRGGFSGDAGHEGSIHELMPDSRRPEVTTPNPPESLSAPQGGTHRIGRFELRKQLGKGGCGIVFLAFDPKLRREVALKIPRPEMLMSPDAKRRLMREAEAAAEFDHPNLVPVYETGEIGPVCFIATAFCPGQTLAEWLEKQSFPVPVRQSARLVATLAEAVQHAHDRGVLHRDLKPNNVILQGIRTDPNAAEGPPPGSCPLRHDHFVPRIVDFGLAKLPERGPSDTVTRQILGTPKYMAPEQAQGRRDDIGPQADVYALGVVLYEMMAGRAPYEGPTDVDVMRQAIEGDLTPPRHLRADTPRDLEAICLKAMAVTPAKRYRTAIDLADDLRRYLDGLPTLARPLNWPGRATRWIRRNDQLFAFAVLITVCLVLFAVGAWNVYQTRQLKTARENDRLENAERIRADQRLTYSRQVRDASLAWRAGDHSQMADSLASARLAADWIGDPPDFTLGYLSRIAKAGQLSIICPAGSVTALTTSQTGKWLASGHADGTVTVWDRATGEMRGSVRVHEGEIAQLGFAWDGTVLFTLPRGNTGNEELLGWLVSRDGELSPVPGARRSLGKGVTCFIASPDRLCVYTAGPKGVLTKCDLRDSQQDVSVRASNGVPVTALAVTPAGKQLLSAEADGLVRRWSDQLAPDTEFRPQQYQGGITALSATDTGQPIVGFANGEIHVPSGGEPRTISTGAPVHWLARMPRGEIAAAGRPGRILIGDSDLATGDIGAVRAGRLASDGKTLFTAGEDGIIRSWDVTADPRQLAARHSGRVLAVGVHPAGHHFVAVTDHILLRDTGDAQSRVIEGGPRSLREVQVLPDGTVRGVAIEGRSAGLWLLSGNVGQELFRATIPDGRLAVSAALSPDGHILAVGDDAGRVSVWSADEHVLLRTITMENRRPVERVVLSDSGKSIAAPTAGGIGVWNVADGHHICTAAADETAIFRFLPDGERLVTGGRGGVVKLWSLAGREELALYGHVGRVTGLGVSPDGRTLVTGGAMGEVKFWDLRTGLELLSFRRHSTAVTVIEFSADGLVLVTAGDGQVAVWDARE